MAVILALISIVFSLTAIAQQTKEHDRFESDHPEARAAWFAAGRQAPAGSHVRAWYYLRAWRHAQAMPRLLPGRGDAGRAHAATLSGNWTELGPKPENAGQYGAVAGRVTAIAVDLGDSSGNTVYLGAAYGGLWKSTNALSANPTFTPIGDNMPTLAVGAIALDSSTNPATIYVGTGEPNISEDSYYGVGILKSTDGGKTWKTTSGDNDGHNFFGLTWSRILVDPDNPKIVLAAASYSGAYVIQGGALSTYGLFVSTDGGVTFSPKVTGPPCTDLAYDSQTRTYYAVIAGSGVWTSSDQGTTWKSVSSPFVNGVKPTPSNFARASLAARNGMVAVLIARPDNHVSTPTACPATVTSTTVCDTGLAQSSDGGKTWKPIALPKPDASSDSLFCSAADDCQGNFDQYVAMPSGGSDLIVGGIDAYRLSGGSGLTASWTNLTQSYGSGSVHPDEHAFAAGADGSIWFIGNDGGVWRSSDKGANWTNLNGSLGVIQFVSVSADLGQSGVYFGGSQDNGTARSDPAAGLAWDLIWGGDGGYTFDNPTQPQQYFSENPGFQIVRSDDGGQHFVDVVDASTIPDDAEFYVPYALSSDSTQAYVATTRVWQGPVNPTGPGIGWQPVSGDLTTGGTCSSSGQPQVLSAIAVAPSDPNYVYVGSSTGLLSVTKNATAAQPVWSGSQIGLCSPISSIAIDPTNPQYAYATKQGFATGPGNARVFATSNGGIIWEDISRGLPNVPVNSIVLDPRQPQDIFIGTDTGVFASSDGADFISMFSPGESWEQLGAGLPATAVLQLNIAQENGSSTVVAATHGRGAWAIPAAAPPNFVLSTDQTTYLAPLNDTQVQFVVHVKMINGSTSPVQLECSSQDTGATCSLSPSSVSASGDVTVTVNTQQNWLTHQIGIAGHDATHRHGLSVTLDAEDYQVGAEAPAALDLEYGSSMNIPITLFSDYGWNSAVSLDCPGLPPGLTCNVTPASFASLPAGATSSNLTLAASSSASATSPAQVTVEAISSQITRKAILSVNLAHFTLSLPDNQVNVMSGTDSVTTTVTAKSSSNSTQSITLACQHLDQQSLPCSFNPTTIQPGQSSTLTISGLRSAVGIGYSGARIAVQGTAGSDTYVSAPFKIAISDFEISGNVFGGGLLYGADTYTWSFQYISQNYSAPVTLTCSADQNVQCVMNPSTVSGSGSTQFKLTNLSAIKAGTVVHVTFNAANSDLQRQMTSSFTVADFQLQSMLPSVGVMPGQFTGAAWLTASVTNNFYLGQFTFGCAPDQNIICQANSTGINTGSINVNATQYLQSGKSLPVNIELTASATQDGSTVTHTLTLPVERADFSLSGPADAAIVTAGGSTNFTVKFNPINNFQGQLSVQCTGAPVGATCEAISSPSFVPGSTDFKVTTTASSQVRSAGGRTRVVPFAFPGEDGPRSGLGVLGCGVLGVLLLAGAALAGARDRRRLMLQGSGIAVLAMTLLACGGGGGGGGYTPTPGGGGGSGTPTGTPAGTSTLTVTATYSDPTAPAGPVNLVRTTTVTLKVQ